ncbi:MAG: 30S ribosomal protein S7 [candidate division Zixibacteria bacterium]|nr:30S ribosomal protein S7 [candidate division Zixibacteria bacterium]
MPRRKSVAKREVLPDPKFQDVTVTQFVNGLMQCGKKSVAEHILYEAFLLIEKDTQQPGLEVFRKAMDNVRPLLEVKSRRVGGATYQVPIEVRPARRTALAIRWLISFARDRKEHSMAEKLAAEMVAAAKKEGSTIKKREDTHRMAEANKAFAHFRW